MSDLAYFILETDEDNGRIVPCIAERGVTGYRRVNYTWTCSKADAVALTDDMNERMGLSKQEAAAIVLSTLRKPQSTLEYTDHHVSWKDGSENAVSEEPIDVVVRPDSYGLSLSVMDGAAELVVEYYNGSLRVHIWTPDQVGGDPDTYELMRPDEIEKETENA